MVYSVGGVALDNPTLGWALVSGSKLRSEVSRSAANVSVQGRDGVVAGVPADAGPAPLTLVVDTPEDKFGALYALFAAGGKLTSSLVVGVEAEFEYLSHTVSEDPDNEFLQVTFVVRVPGTFWRDVNVSTSSAVSINAASVVADVFSGLSAPVPDAIVRVKGAVGGLQVTDNSGAWFTFDAVGSSEYLRFESDSGRAFITTSDVWTGGAEVSGEVDFGGPRGVFEITPRLTPADPSSRVGRLTVTTSSRSAASVQVRGRGAYVI